MKSVYFCSFSQSYSVVLSFGDLLSVTRKKLKSQIPTIRVKLKVKKAKTIYLSFDNDEVIDIVLQLYMSSKSQSNSEFINLNNNIPGFGLSWDEQDCADWKKKQSYFVKNKCVEVLPKSVKEWEEYFSYFGVGSTIIRTHHLANLIMDGIPNHFRRMLLYFIYNEATGILKPVVEFSLSLFQEVSYEKFAFHLFINPIFMK